MLKNEILEACETCENKLKRIVGECKGCNVDECGIDECRGGTQCWYDNHPPFKTCSKCSCFSCIRGDCQPAKWYCDEKSPWSSKVKRDD